MYELNVQTLIRRDSLSITATESLINDARDTVAKHISVNDLSWLENVSENFFDLEITDLNRLTFKRR